MSWLKLDDCFFRHPKVIAAGRDARDLYLAGLCYCGAGLTDGVIPAGALRILGADADIDDPKAAVTTLVRVGLWEMIESGEYRVHDYLEYNPSAEKVKAERKAAQERMRRNRSGGVRANNGRSSEDVREPRPVPSYSRTR
jgi:hypothetical protein